MGAPSPETEVDTMESMSIQLEVIETCSALSRPHASRRSGVVSADISATYQGTGLSFAGLVDAIGVDVAPRTRKGGPSGTTIWSPPV
jgi:hypothetical protein